MVDTAAKEAGAGTLPPNHELMDNIYLVSSIVEAEGGKIFLWLLSLLISFLTAAACVCVYMSCLPQHDATARAIELKDSRIVPKENEENNNWGHDLSYRNATGEAAQKKWIQ